MPRFAYTAHAVASDTGALADVRLEFAGKTWHLAGRHGARREAAQADAALARPEALPVVLGAGLGHAVERLLAEGTGPIAVVDREAPILALTGTREHFGADPRITWIDAPEPDEALRALTRWQMEHGGAPLIPVISPVYPRLDQAYYGELAGRAKASGSFDFWAKARYAKFTGATPRILFITSQYFLMGEVVTAAQRLGVEHRFLQVHDDEVGRTEFVEELLSTVVEFKPDFVFTINHLGVDREGVLMDLLERLDLPIASWFVDNPHLILYLYDKLVSDHTMIFTWDADNLDSLRAQGFAHVHYLPLGTDARRFAPPDQTPATHPWAARVAFVGNSMHHKVAHRMKKGRFPRPLLLGYREVAAGFAEHDEPSVRAFLRTHHPDKYPHFEALDTAERQLAYEAMITWEATRQYRLRCVKGILPFAPLIVGDSGWNVTFRGRADWRWHEAINYYTDLPVFYPLQEINFNCTSKQMKGAVNQRVFDVPACGAFVLTDWRAQMEHLFEPGTEIAYFTEPDEVEEKTRRYLDHPDERRAIVAAARKRILAEHTYEHRLRTVIDLMRTTFA